MKVMSQINASVSSSETKPSEKVVSPAHRTSPSHHPYYSQYYERLQEIGHIGSTPEFSAPALIWHVATWPLRTHDPQNVLSVVEELEVPDGANSGSIRISKNVKEHLDSIRPSTKRRNANAAPIYKEGKSFNDLATEQCLTHTATSDAQFNALLLQLQRLGRANKRRDQFERIGGVSKHDQTAYTAYFDTLRHDAIGFTIWWEDEGPIAGKLPGPGAIRIRVEAVRHVDFATITFFVDATAVWKNATSGASPTSAGPKTLAGVRRAATLDHIANIRKICDARLTTDIVEQNPLPEKLGDSGAGNELLEASLYLYDKLWDEFCRDFKLGSDANPLDLSAITGGNKLSRVFANFRGLVIAADGFPPVQETRPLADPAYFGSQPFYRFRNNDGNSSTPNEANAVVKAYWPFIRRITPAMDYRDVVACGVMNWRCLTITSLGSYIKDDPTDESEGLRIDVPDPSLRMDMPDFNEAAWEPVRHLFITKGAPNPKQIGRIVERICNLETIRLFALKEWHVLENASIHVRIRGQELDQIIHEWTMGRAYIDAMHQADQNKRGRGKQDIDDRRDEWITAYTRYIEKRLLSIGAALDRIGQSCVGGIHYRIGRSRLYAREFELLLRTLQLGNIETRISYEQFTTRGLKPALGFINDLGIRLDSLRRRFQTVTDGIEASALVAQTSATRQNTMELKRITRTAKMFSSAGFLSAGAVFAHYTRLLVDSFMNAPANFQWTDIAGPTVGAILMFLAAAFFAAILKRG